MSPTFQRRLPLLTTGAVLVGLFAIAAMRYEGFFSGGVLGNLLTDNATLGITAVGLTLVIFSGGIDLSVGAVVGFTSILTATLLHHGWSPWVACPLALAIGTGLGAGMGAFIHFFRQPAFLITLAGMFLMRGLAYWITTESLPVDHPLFVQLAQFSFSIGESFNLPTTAMTLLGALALGAVLAHWTRFGRNLLAIGGSEQSAVLMGLPVAAAKVGAYAFSGFCAALAGLVATIDGVSGNPRFGVGLELDAIAVVVIGGTLLTGGRGNMLGTVLGLLIFGTIKSALVFASLSSHWTRIVVGALLLAFILLQRFFVRGAARARTG
jgi:ribose/xylose/arabinose/galactoside ABC-type transport system permease subunit